MLITIATILVIAFLVFYYETKTVNLELALAATEDVVDDLMRRNKALTQQAIDQQRMIAQPFDHHARQAIAVTRAEKNVIALADELAVADGYELPASMREAQVLPFSQAEIDQYQ